MASLKVAPAYVFLCQVHSSNNVCSAHVVDSLYPIHYRKGKDQLLALIIVSNA